MKKGRIVIGEGEEGQSSCECRQWLKFPTLPRTLRGQTLGKKNVNKQSCAMGKIEKPWYGIVDAEKDGRQYTGRINFIGCITWGRVGEERLGSKRHWPRLRLESTSHYGRSIASSTPG